MKDSAAVPISPNSPDSRAQTLEQGFSFAVACHRAGRVDQAESLYAAILQAQPGHPDANHNLGILYVQARKFSESFPFLLAAIEADPSSSSYWLSYIEALILAEQWDDARLVLTHARAHGLEGNAVEALAARLPLQTVATIEKRR